MINIKNTISGKYRIEVLDSDDNVISDTGWGKNLIIKTALNNSYFINHPSNTLSVYMTETDVAIDPVVTPNKRVLDGVVSQTGTTLTAPSEFLNSTPHKKPVDGDIILFADGTRSIVNERISDTELLMYTDVTVTAQSASHYRVGLTLNNAVLSGQPYRINVENSVHGQIILQRQQLVNDPTYNEVVYSGISTQMTSTFTANVVYFGSQSRVVLDTPIQLTNGNRVRFSWKRRVDFGASNFYENDNKITGLPFKTVVNTINADGTDITVTTQTDHYWIVGDEVNISDAIPDGSATAPTTYFNGNWVVSSVPDSTTVKLTSNLPNTTTQSSVGFISSKNANHSVHYWGDWHDRYYTTPQNWFVSEIDELPTKPAFTDTTDPTLSSASNTFIQIPSSGVQQLSTPNPSVSNNFTWSGHLKTLPSEQLNYTRMKQFLFESIGSFNQPKVFILVTFDHVQTKLNTFDLQIFFRIRNIPDLS